MNVRQFGRRRRLSMAGLVAAATLLATSCAGSDGAGAGGGDGGPFKFYVSLGKSGANSKFAPAFGDGLQAAVDTINKNGGLLGRKVEMEVENNESDPTKAVSLLQERLREDTPDLVWAGSTSSDALAMLGVLNREKIMTVSPGSAEAVGDSSKFPYSFTAGVTSASIAEFLTQHLTDEGYQRVGLLTANDAFGETVAKRYRTNFEAAGIEVISETYETDAVEMDGPLARIEDKNPEAVVVSDFVHPTYILKSRTKLGMGDIPFVGDLSTTVTDISETLSEEDKAGVSLATFEVQTTRTDSKGVQNLLDALAENDVKIKGGLQLYSQPYDNLLAYANAVEAVGSTDVDKVRAAMEGNKGDKYLLASSDDLGWTEDVHQATTMPYLMIPVSRMNANGQFEVAAKGP